jgi:geranylgeranyl pyrophosphate synthase
MRATLASAAGSEKSIGGFTFSTALKASWRMRSNLRDVTRKLSSFRYDAFSDTNMFGPATHLLGRPGKLLRPALVFLGAEMIGADSRQFVDLAAGAEILHTASLVHDDLIDEDSTRRRISSVHSKYGNEAAILAGDALVAKGIMLISKYGHAVTSTMSKTALDMCAGELLDYGLQKQRRIPSTKEYIKIAKLKSGSLLGACCSVVPRYAGNAMTDEMFLFGMNAGVAFQIRDDIIESVDKRERRVNGAGKGRAYKPDIVRSIMKSDGMGKSKAVEKAVVLNNYFADVAVGSIRKGIARQALSDYINFVRVRKY